ncbi:MAG: hexose kinase [Planctomycetaceae bacterium]|nr:hexose kinase [Planctomycetaceae bacterium]
MILSAGLSPAWQRVMLFDDLQHGEVNRAREVFEFASGKVLNTAIGLHHLGCDVTCLSPVGGTPSAAIRDEFEEMQIDSRWIETQSATRTCITLLNETAGQTTELVENAEPIRAEELSSWIAQFRLLSKEADLVVFSGSLPAGVPRTILAELMAEGDVPFVLDARNEELISALPNRPLVIKPNREELGQTVGRELTETSDVIAAAEELRTRGAQWVIVTDGPRPVIVVGPEVQCQVNVPAVERIINPIGCGDSLTAGLSAALSEGHTLVEAVKWGIACSQQNLGMLLPARLDRGLMLDDVASISVERL